jgi:hypothetical protein
VEQQERRAARQILNLVVHGRRVDCHLAVPDCPRVAPVCVAPHRNLRVEPRAQHAVADDLRIQRVGIPAEADIVRQVYRRLSSACSQVGQRVAKHARATRRACQASQEPSFR